MSPIVFRDFAKAKYTKEREAGNKVGKELM